MSDIAKMAIVLGASISGFSAGMAKAGTDVKQFASTVQSAGSSITGAWGGITAKLGLLLGGFAAFQSLDHADQTVRKLDAVIRSTGQAAGFTSPQIQKLAAELAQTTRFSKMTTVNAAAVLATFTQIKGDVFTDALKAAQDLSTVLGQDLQSSIIQIGKALNSPEEGVNALRRVGVAFNDEQRNLIKTLQDSGDLLGAQKVILAELKTEFGGAAAEAGKGFGASIERAKAAIAGISKEIMSAIVPAIGTFAKAVQDAANWIKSHETVLHSLGKTMMVVAMAVTGYKVVVLAVTAATKAWSIAQAVALALQGPKGWLMLAGAAAAFAAGMGLVNSAFDSAEQAAARSNETTAKGLNNQINLQQKAAAGLEKLAEDTKKLAEETKKLNKDADDYLQHLIESIKTVGMDEAQKKLRSMKTAMVWKTQEVKWEGERPPSLFQYNKDTDSFTTLTIAQRVALELGGKVTTCERLISEEKIKQVEAAQQQLKIAEANLETQKELDKAAAHWREEIKTPLDKLEDKRTELGALLGAGKLTPEQYQKAIDKVQADFERQMLSENPIKKTKEPNYNYDPTIKLMERRFMAGYREPKEDKKTKILERQAKAAERTAKNTDDLVTNLANVVGI